MLDLKHNGYYPLTLYHLRLLVPSDPGVFTLATRLENGAHRTFYGGQSEDLYATLRAIACKDALMVPGAVLEHLEQHQCYFTYFIISEKEYRNEVEKMLVFTADPVSKLKIEACN